MLLVRKQISLRVNIYDDDFQHCLDRAALFQLPHLLLCHHISHWGENLRRCAKPCCGVVSASAEYMLLEEYSHSFGISGPLGPKHLKYFLLVE